jgi:hypothetical protein
MKRSIIMFALLSLLQASASAQGMLTAIHSSPPTTVNLTAEGTLDWIHWGYIDGTSVRNRKTKGGIISEVTKIGTREMHTYADNPTAFTWSNGEPAAVVEQTTSGVLISEHGYGFEVSVPADTQKRRLTIYFGVWRTNGQLEATLSDGSAAAYTSKLESQSASAITNAAYTLEYRAAKPGQKLTVRLTNVGQGGNMGFQAATLSQPAAR